MRIALLVVVALSSATPALAQAPGDTSPAPAQGPSPAPPPGPVPGVPAPVPVPAPGSQPDPAPPSGQPPKVDPYYGEGPEEGGPTNVAPGDNRHLQGNRVGRDIVVRYHPDRSRNNIIGIAATAGAGLLFGAVGLYYHLDSRDLSDSVSADDFTGLTWSEARQDEVDRAERSAMIAGVMYGIGGALVLATAIAYIVTEPDLETHVIHPHTNRRPVALVAPSPGGAIVGGAWRF